MIMNKSLYIVAFSLAFATTGIAQKDVYKRQPLKSTGWPFTSICPPFSSILRKPTLIGSTSTVLLPFFRVAVSV